jgi:hypothetical protein
MHALNINYLNINLFALTMFNNFYACKIQYLIANKRKKFIKHLVKKKFLNKSIYK